MGIGRLLYARHCGIPNYIFSLTIKKACVKNKGGYWEQTLCSAWPGQSAIRGSLSRKRGCQEVLEQIDGWKLMVTGGTEDLARTAFKS